MWRKEVCGLVVADELPADSFPMVLFQNITSAFPIEGVYQFGKFAEKDINAWTISFNTGYKFSRAKLKPTRNVRCGAKGCDQGGQNAKKHRVRSIIFFGRFFKK